jgi:hypothetical protein
MLKFIANRLQVLRVFQILAALLVVSSAAYADCASLQKGKEIFADTFTDDTGGWPVDPDASFGKTGLTLKLHTPNTSWVFLNNTFNATDGDYCLDGTLPAAAAADNLAYIGLALLAKDAKTFVLFQVDSKGDIQLYRKVSGNWLPINTNLGKPSLGLKAGAAVTLRAVVKKSLLSVSANGAELQKVRVQVPDGPLQFGVYVQTDSGAPKPGVSFEFSKYRVTAGE